MRKFTCKANSGREKTDEGVDFGLAVRAVLQRTKPKRDGGAVLTPAEAARIKSDALQVYMHIFKGDESGIYDPVVEGVVGRFFSHLSDKGR